MKTEFRVRQSVRHLVTKHVSEDSGTGSLSTVCELDNWERAIDLAQFLAKHTPGGTYADNSSEMPDIPRIEPEVQVKGKKPLQRAMKTFVIVTWNLDLAHRALNHWVGKDKWEAKIVKTQQTGRTWQVFVSVSYTCHGANNHDLVTSAKEAFREILTAHDTSYVNFDSKTVTTRLEA